MGLATGSRRPETVRAAGRTLTDKDGEAANLMRTWRRASTRTGRLPSATCAWAIERGAMAGTLRGPVAAQGWHGSGILVSFRDWEVNDVGPQKGQHSGKPRRSGAKLFVGADPAGRGEMPGGHMSIGIAIFRIRSLAAGRARQPKRVRGGRPRSRWKYVQGRRRGRRNSPLPARK